MSAMTRTRLCLPTAALILAAAVAVPAAAQQQVPFKGVLQGVDVDSPVPAGTVVVTTTGSGMATHLGNFTFTQQATVDLAAGTSAGTVHFVAANGDTLDATCVGSGVPIVAPDGILISITETCTITGGTGRFTGAKGSYTVERLASPVAFTTSGSFRGSMTSPGAVH